ncbi:MAG: DUF4398 domain-containing protein [Lysobacteraceae bacterium]
MDRAQRAIAEATSMDARDYAPVEYDTATAHMREAEALYVERETRNADAAASQAEVNADLAIAKSRAAKARATVQRKPKRTPDFVVSCWVSREVANEALPDRCRLAGLVRAARQGRQG